MGVTTITVNRSMWANTDDSRNWMNDLDAAHAWLVAHAGKEMAAWRWHTIEPHAWSVEFQDPNVAMLFKLTWG